MTIPSQSRQLRALMLKRETISLLRTLTTAALHRRDQMLAADDLDGLEDLNDYLRLKILVAEESAADYTPGRAT